jgi:hypothetical protein
MITPFVHTPYAYFKPAQEKRERIPMQLYIDLIGYDKDDVVEESDDVDQASVGDLSLGASSLGASSRGGEDRQGGYAEEPAPEAAVAAGGSVASSAHTPGGGRRRKGGRMGAKDKDAEDDLTLASGASGWTAPSHSTASTLLPSATKKHIQRVVRDIAKDTQYEYLEAEHKAPKKYRVSRLWQRFVTGPFVAWRRKQALDRRHPVLKYYEQRVVRFEAQRIDDIGKEMDEHARFIQKAANRLAKLRTANTKVRSIQERIAGKHVHEVAARDRQLQRTEFDMFYHPKWASDSKARADAQAESDAGSAEQARLAGLARAAAGAVSAGRQYEIDFFAEDTRETQKIQEMMRRAGVVAGVNAPPPLPCNSHARSAEQSELVPVKPNKKGKNVNIKEEEEPKPGQGQGQENVSAFDQHAILLKAMGMKKAAPPISRKARELVVGLADSVDFTVHPRHRGRMPWHSAGGGGGGSGGGGSMAVFDIDLSLYRDVLTLRCEKLGERGALCLAAEFVRGACPGLTDLNLNRCQITSRGFGRVLSGIRLARMDSLTSLQLRGNLLGARCIEYLHSALERGALGGVALLDLRENELGVAGAHALGALFFSGLVVALRELRIQRNGLGDEGYAHIVNVMRSIHDAKCPQLACLKVGENQASVAVVAEFAPYPHYIQP